MANDFFEEQKEQSLIKAEIVSKYFGAWSFIMANRRNVSKIAYIDLYAGRGKFDDGSISTPIMVLKQAEINNKLYNKLVTFFNDVDPKNTTKLQIAINNLPDIGKFQHQPKIRCGEVDAQLENYFSGTSIIPSFTFLDPWGYKGLSLKIIKGLIKDWGCECIFFFNYNRINMGISNDDVKKHMIALLGKDRFDKLRKKIENVGPKTRQLLILEEISSVLKEIGGKYVLPFRFKNERGRLTHHLIFVSKHFRGYEIMKSIMSKASSESEQGVPSFSFSPAEESTPLLFSLNQPLEVLKDSLLEEFSGKSLTMREIYEEHSVDRPFIESNYKKVLLEMEDDGTIDVENVSGKIRRKGTFADHLLVHFPD